MRKYETTFNLDEIDEIVSVTVFYQKTKFGMEVSDIVLDEEFEYDGEEYAEGVSLFSCDLDKYAIMSIEEFAGELEEELTNDYENRVYESSMYYYEREQEISYGRK